MLDRAAFDAALVAAAEQAGARCAFGAGVRSVRPDGRVELADGRTIVAKVVVGADGPRSIVGRAIGQSQPAARRDAADHGAAAASAPSDGYLSFGRHSRRIRLAVSKGRCRQPRRRRRSGAQGAAQGHRRRPACEPRRKRPRRPGDPRDDRWPDPGGRHAAAVGNARRHAGAARWRCRRPGQPGDRRRHSRRRCTRAGSQAEAAASHVSGTRTAGADYEEELESVFKACAGSRVAPPSGACRSAATGAAPDKAALRRGWIAYPQYWAA